MEFDEDEGTRDLLGSADIALIRPETTFPSGPVEVRCLDLPVLTCS